MRGYRINLLGAFECTYNGKTFDRIPTGKLQLLFVYLLLHMDMPIERKELAFLFWPESADHQAQTNLRKLLYHLKNRLPSVDKYLQLEDGQIIWKSAKGCWVDTAEFTKCADRKQIADLIQAESIYRGHLLPGVHADWLIQRRDALFLAYTEVVQALVHACEQKRNYTQAIHYTNKWIHYDPLAENAHLMLIRLHLVNGNRTAAIHQHNKMSALLRQQLGVLPSREATELYTQLLQPNFDAASLSTREPAPFVGRDQEWASLQRYWEKLKSERSCFVLIEGEKGMGKSHLLEQFSHWVGVQGTQVRMSKCYPSKKDIPYETVIQWLEDADVSGLPPAYLSELSRIIPSLLDRYPDVSQPEKIDDPWKLRYFYEALETALGWRTKSLVLFIDDGQWMDDETFSFLEFMMRPERKQPLLLVTTLRTNTQETSKSARSFAFEAVSHVRKHYIQLGPFTETDTKQLVDMLHLAHDERNVRQIYAVSGGNPLYIQEWLLNHGQREDDERLDATFRELMLQRLATLPKGYRQITDSLAVISAPVSLPVLMAICAMPEQAMLESVDVLYQLRFLRETERGRIDFFHDTIREAVLSVISSAHRTLLHANIAEAMDKYRQDGMFSAAEIAFHYDQSGNLGKAIPYYEQAAAKAYALYDHDQTIVYAQRLLKMLPAEKSSQQLAWLAHAYRMKGNLEQAVNNYRRFLQPSNGTVPLEEAAMMRVQLAVCMRLKGNYHEALSMLASVARQLEWVKDNKGLIEVYRQMTTAYIHLGQFAQAQQYLEWSRGDRSDRKEKCVYLGLKADLLYEQAHYEEALDVYQQLIQLANRVDTRIPLLGALFGMALTYLETDQYAHAFESVLECIRLTRSVGDQVGLGLAIGILGKIYLRAGWVQEAVACLHYGLKQAQQSGDRRSTAILTGLLGHAMQLQEHSEEEIALLRRAEQLSKELQFPLFHGNSLYYLGHAYCAREKWAEAQSCLNKALQMMIRDGRSDLLCKVRLLLLQCELATGKITLTNAIEQIQEWLPKYPLRKDQMEMYITLWKWSEKEDVRQEAKRFVTEMYNSMPIPAYRQFMAAMKQAPSIQIMKHPPLPEEVTSYAPL